jgi:chloride channel 3/4/5
MEHNKTLKTIDFLPYSTKYPVFDFQGWALITLTGIISAFIAVFISISTEWLNDLKFGFCSTNWYLPSKFCCLNEKLDSGKYCQDWISFDNLIIYTLLSIIFSLMSSYLVISYSKFAAGSGIPLIKVALSGFTYPEGYLGGWTLATKSVGLILSVSSGLCLGKEGPLVHVSCCVGHILCSFFPRYKYDERGKRAILSACAACGVSIAFGAPIGGVLFALEEVSYYFPREVMLRSFFCALIGAVVVQIMDPYRTNQLVLFQVSYHTSWRAFEVFFFLFIGIFGGIFGALFANLNIRYNEWRARPHSYSSRYPLMEVLVISAVTGVFNYITPFTRINLVELIAALFEECSPNAEFGLCGENGYGLIIVSLLFTFFLKGVLTIITIGISLPAGIYVPSIAVGACFGRVFGIIVQHLFSGIVHCPTDTPCINPGLYALVGAAATLAGVTRMTICLVVIMFELTGALTSVLPLMISVMVAKWVADYLGEGIYDELIRLYNYPFLDKDDDLDGVLEEYMSKDLIVVHEGQACQEVHQLLSLHYRGFPVFKYKSLIGYISRENLHLVENEDKLKAISFTGCSDAFNLTPYLVKPHTLSPKLSMTIVLKIFRQLGLRFVLVVENGKCLGIVTRKDIIKAVKEHRVKY